MAVTQELAHRHTPIITARTCIPLWPFQRSHWVRQPCSYPGTSYRMLLIPAFPRLEFSHASGLNSHITFSENLPSPSKLNTQSLFHFNAVLLRMDRGIALWASPGSVRDANSWTPPRTMKPLPATLGGGQGAPSLGLEPAPTHTGEQTAKFPGILQADG